MAELQPIHPSPAPSADRPRVLPEYQRELQRAVLLVAGCSVLLLVLIFVPAAQFALPPWLNLSAHTLVETISIVVSALVFSVGWYTYSREPNGTVALVCNAFLAVAILDFVHMLSFEGMPALNSPSGGGKAISFFLAARLMAALALLALAFMPSGRQIGRAARYGLLVVCLAFALAVSALGLLNPEVQRLFMVPGMGLTTLKVGVEYLIVALNLAAAAGFVLRMRSVQPFPVVDLFAAAAIAALSELCLTLYTSTHDQFNLAGHVYKFMAYLLVYRALFVTLVLRPYLRLEAARRDLQDSEEKFRMLFTTSLDGVLLTSLRGEVYAANPAACAMFGLTQQQMCQLDPAALLKSGGPRLREMVAALQRQTSVRGELRLRRADGSAFDAELSAALQPDRTGQQLVSVVVRDISESRRAREEILQLNESLEQRVRDRTAQLALVNEELKGFASSVAHDLRSPLVAVAGFTKVLENALGPRLDGRERHYMERIQAGVSRMEEMISVLLKLAQLSRVTLVYRPLDLTDMARQVLAQCQERDPARTVQVSVQEGLHAEGDRVLMMLVLENLIGNAWKFSAQRPDAQISVGAETLKGEQVFFVHDNGAGFDMAGYSKLFGVFQRLHSSGEFPGHGIGLANVRRIIARHNGRVWAESAPGQGATFRFTLGDAEVAGPLPTPSPPD